MNEQILSIIEMVQSYKRFILQENMFYGSIGKPELQKNCYEETRKYFNSIDPQALRNNGLSTNIISFEKVLDFRVTDEMLGTEYKDLGKFKF